jgi:hypothetical protein
MQRAGPYQACLLASASCPVKGASSPPSDGGEGVHQTTELTRSWYRVRQIVVVGNVPAFIRRSAPVSLRSFTVKGVDGPRDCD